MRTLPWTVSDELWDRLDRSGQEQLRDRTAPGDADDAAAAEQKVDIEGGHTLVGQFGVGGRVMYAPHPGDAVRFGRTGGTR